MAQYANEFNFDFDLSGIIRKREVSDQKLSIISTITKKLHSTGARNAFTGLNRQVFLIIFVMESSNKS